MITMEYVQSPGTGASQQQASTATTVYTDQDRSNHHLWHRLWTEESHVNKAYIQVSLKPFFFALRRRERDSNPQAPFAQQIRIACSVHHASSILICCTGVMDSAKDSKFLGEWVLQIRVCFTASKRKKWFQFLLIRRWSPFSS